MEALFLLIPLSLVALGAAVWFFMRMNASGQFDDTEGPAYSILLDDDSVAAQKGRASDAASGQADPAAETDAKLTRN